MADRRTIQARAAVAPVPPLILNQRSDYQKDCCQTGHSGRIRDLSPLPAGCGSVINSLCTKTVGQPHSTCLNCCPLGHGKFVLRLTRPKYRESLF
jgi:hypothetical protein